VTPLSLGIAIVGGYTQVIIPRNSPVPMDRTKRFSTSRDGQTEVTIRICQGESRRFDDNTVLGELELSGLKAAPRGQTQVDVTFEIDTNGILKVQASDEETGHAQQATIKLRGAASGAKRSHLLATGAEGEYQLPAGAPQTPGEGA
jgi:molecular chaperone DnaK